MLSPIQVRRIAVLGFLACLVVALLTLLVGIEIKGARRWIMIAGFSLQVSEFIKPTFAVVAAWLFAAGARDPNFPGSLITMTLYAAKTGLIIDPPALGTAAVLSAAWVGTFFLHGVDR